MSANLTPFLDDDTSTETENASPNKQLPDIDDGIRWEISAKGNDFTRLTTGPTITVYPKDGGFAYCIARSKSDLVFSPQAFATREGAKRASITAVMGHRKWGDET
jgi:hypothetical protein